MDEIYIQEIEKRQSQVIEDEAENTDSSGDMLILTNGMSTDNKQVMSHRGYGGDAAGRPVCLKSVYNPSHNFLDVEESILVLNNVATTPAIKLAKVIEEFYDTAPVGARLLLIGHSQGAAIIKIAL